MKSPKITLRAQIADAGLSPASDLNRPSPTPGRQQSAKLSEKEGKVKKTNGFQVDSDVLQRVVFGHESA